MMKCTCGYLSCGFANKFFRTKFHFLCCFVCKSYSYDSIWAYAAGLDQIGNPMSYNPGLAASRASYNQNRAIYLLNCFYLGWIQIVQYIRYP